MCGFLCSLQARNELLTSAFIEHVFFTVVHIMSYLNVGSGNNFNHSWFCWVIFECIHQLMPSLTFNQIEIYAIIKENLLLLKDRNRGKIILHWNINKPYNSGNVQLN